MFDLVLSLLSFALFGAFNFVLFRGVHAYLKERKRGSTRGELNAKGLPASSGRSAAVAGSHNGRHPASVVAPYFSAIDALRLRAGTLAEPLHRENANRRFLEPLTTYVPERLAEAKKALQAGAPIAGAQQVISSMTLVLDELEALIEQRRDGVLRGALGDADTLANACYAPIAQFARAEGIPLTTLVPATQLGPFEMSTWTGFIPTSIAPIFLPQDFFERALWWPAVAHEIAHDFLVSVTGLEGRLRSELGFRPFTQSYLPIDFSQGFSEAEVQRVVGAWFEELFCDVFGTLMCGPAYVATMIEVFAAKGDPREALVVGVDPDGRGYDCHPPGHLRVMAACSVLSRAGFHRDAQRLQKQWEKKCRFESLRGEGAEAELELFLLFPTAEGYVRVTLEPFETSAVLLAARLYSGPLQSLSGMSLRDVPGLDYGPHAHEEGLRARASLLEGRVPRVRDVRAVIAGAVLASLDRPGSERSLLELARRAIPAFGTSEVRPDAYSHKQERGALSIDAETIRDAVVLREVLARPGARQR